MLTTSKTITLLTSNFNIKAISDKKKNAISLFSEKLSPIGMMKLVENDETLTEDQSFTKSFHSYFCNIEKRKFNYFFIQALLQFVT